MLYKILSGIALAVSTAFIIEMVLYMDYHKTLWNHRPGKCHIVEGIDYGSEDMQTTKSGLTFITSGVNAVLSGRVYQEYYKKHNVRGRIMLFNMEKPEEGVKELKITGNKFSYDDFYPHGISVLEDKDKVLLFVVVHRNEHDTVEKFEFLEKTLELKHLETYTGTLVHTLNDVAATGPDTFYTTDCLYYRDSRHILEIVFGLHFGHVLYYNGSNLIIASEPTYTANGIALSTNGRLVYVASGSRNMMVYKRELNDKLTKVNVLMLHMDSSGTNTTGVTALFSDDLELYSSSVASLNKSRMLIGTVCHKMMYCEIN